MQIIDGVVNSQKYAQEKGAMVNPVGMIYKEGVLGGHQPIQVDVIHSSQEFFIPQMIEFDIAVTVTEGGEIRAGLEYLVEHLG